MAMSGGGPVPPWAAVLMMAEQWGIPPWQVVEECPVEWWHNWILWQVAKSARSG